MAITEAQQTEVSKLLESIETYNKHITHYGHITLTGLYISKKISKGAVTINLGTKKLLGKLCIEKSALTFVYQEHKEVNPNLFIEIVAKSENITLPKIPMIGWRKIGQQGKSLWKIREDFEENIKRRTIELISKIDKTWSTGIEFIKIDGQMRIRYIGYIDTKESEELMKKLSEDHEILKSKYVKLVFGKREIIRLDSNNKIQNGAVSVIT